MRTMRIPRGKQMSQEAKEEANEKQRAKRVARLQDEKDADRKRECELQRERRAAARAAEAEKKAHQEQERTRRNSIIRTKMSISEARGGLTRTSGAALLF